MFLHQRELTDLQEGYHEKVKQPSCLDKMGGGSSLIQASSNGDMNKLEKTLNRNFFANVDCVDKAGCTPLFHACRGGYACLLPLLFKSKADPNTPNNEGVTPLHIACRMGHAKCVRLLLENNVDWKCFDPKGHNALIIAATSGHSEVVAELLSAGVDMEDHVKYIPGHTSIFLAAERGYADVVSTLLKGGANAMIKNKLGLTPLHIGSLLSYLITSIHSYIFIQLIIVNSLPKWSFECGIDST